jgi:large conductance mechanosensitive channel
VKKFVDDFKEFALGGTLIETAVGLVMALATAALISALVENIIMPVVGMIFGAPDFTRLWVITVNQSSIRIGSFVTALVTFLAVAFGVYVFVVKPWNAYKARLAAGVEAAPAAPPEDVVLLREIRDALQART